jgi:phosphohistidine phosphatase
MKIYLVRHGIAEPLGEPNRYQDFRRSLTPEGSKKMREVSLGLKALGIESGLVVSSPLMRAKETAEIVVDVLKYTGPIEIWEELAPGASVRQTVGKLQNYEGRDSVFLVGHQPHLGFLASLLVFGDDSLSLDLKKGSVCCIEAEQFPIQPPLPLLWMLPPKMLRLFSGT